MSANTLQFSVILLHPDPNSFNHAIAKTAREALASNGHTVWYYDLCKEKFDPCCRQRSFPKRHNCQSKLRTTAGKLPRRTASLSVLTNKERHGWGRCDKQFQTASQPTIKNRLTPCRNHLTAFLPGFQCGWTITASSYGVRQT